MTDLEPSQPNGQRHDDRPTAAGLTEIEQRILDALVAGKTRREICHELGISPSLYHYHLHALRRYFRVRTTVEVVLAYMRQKAGPEGSPLA